VDVDAAAAVAVADVVVVVVVVAVGEEILKGSLCCTTTHVCCADS
jgi:hypothetical protein